MQLSNESWTLPILRTSLLANVELGISTIIQRWGSSSDTSSGELSSRLIMVKSSRVYAICDNSDSSRLSFSFLSSELPAYVFEGDEPRPPKASGKRSGSKQNAKRAGASPAKKRK